MIYENLELIHKALTQTNPGRMSLRAHDIAFSKEISNEAKVEFVKMMCAEHFGAMYGDNEFYIIYKHINDGSLMTAKVLLRDLASSKNRKVLKWFLDVVRLSKSGPEGEYMLKDNIMDIIQIFIQNNEMAVITTLEHKLDVMAGYIVE